LVWSPQHIGEIVEG